MREGSPLEELTAQDVQRVIFFGAMALSFHKLRVTLCPRRAPIERHDASLYEGHRTLTLDGQNGEPVLHNAEVRAAFDQFRCNTDFKEFIQQNPNALKHERAASHFEFFSEAHGSRVVVFEKKGERNERGEGYPRFRLSKAEGGAIRLEKYDTTRHTKESQTLYAKNAQGQWYVTQHEEGRFDEHSTLKHGTKYTRGPIATENGPIHVIQSYTVRNGQEKLNYSREDRDFAEQNARVAEQNAAGLVDEQLRQTGISRGQPKAKAKPQARRRGDERFFEHMPQPAAASSSQAPYAVIEAETFYQQCTEAVSYGRTFVGCLKLYAESLSPLGAGEVYRAEKLREMMQGTRGLTLSAQQRFEACEALFAIAHHANAREKHDVFQYISNVLEPAPESVEKHSFLSDLEYARAQNVLSSFSYQGVSEQAGRASTLRTNHTRVTAHLQRALGHSENALRLVFDGPGQIPDSYDELIEASLVQQIAILGDMKHVHQQFQGNVARTDAARRQAEEGRLEAMQRVYERGEIWEGRVLEGQHISIKAQARKDLLKAVAEFAAVPLGEAFECIEAKERMAKALLSQWVEREREAEQGVAHGEEPDSPRSGMSWASTVDGAAARVDGFVANTEASRHTLRRRGPDSTQTAPAR